LVHRVLAENLVKLLWRNGLVLPRADPRPDRVAEALALKLIHDTAQSAVLVDDVADDRHHPGADDAAQYSIQESHDIAPARVDRSERKPVLPSKLARGATWNCNSYYLTQRRRGNRETQRKKLNGERTLEERPREATLWPPEVVQTKPC